MMIEKRSVASKLFSSLLNFGQKFCHFPLSVMGSSSTLFSGDELNFPKVKQFILKLNHQLLYCVLLD